MEITREEAISELNTFKVGAKSELGEIALGMAIKALEQKPVLDKIRAELIQAIQNGTLKIESGNEELFRIIDKYK